MVEATTKFGAQARSMRTAAPAAGSAVPFSVSIETRTAAYRRSASALLAAPAQTPEWVDAWICATSPDAVIVSLHDRRGPVLVLPLEVVSSSGAKIARFMGGSHANGNFPLLDATARIDAAALDSLFAAVRTSRPDVDLVRLERLAPEIGGVANPLVQLSHVESPNVALAASLEGGFAGALSRASSRKSKRYRSQLRKFEAVGGARRIVAKTPHEAIQLFDAFAAMKAERFRAMGVADVFAGQQVRAFFRNLFSSSLASGTFTLEGLEVAGKLRAVTGHSRCGDRIVCEFGAIAEDELTHISPGDFLFYENIEAAAKAGYRIYDFSVGDEPYKRTWCSIEQRQFDVLYPLTIRGRAVAAALRAGAGVKRQLKQNPGIWKAVKRARQALLGKGQAAVRPDTGGVGDS